MNPTCERLRPLLYQVAEGEAGPEEALAMARHLAHCTACRIVLAREHRLLAMLDLGLDDVLPIDDEFAPAVMARIPEARRRRHGSKLRVLKLAGLAAWIVAVSFAASHVDFTVPRNVRTAVPRWAAGSDTAGPGALDGIGAALRVAVDVLRASSAAALPAQSVPIAGTAALLLLIGLSIPAAAATALGLASLGPAVSRARPTGRDPRG
jgi:predicted anti-sigma-YlaC factor YlaD